MTNDEIETDSPLTYKGALKEMMTLMDRHLELIGGLGDRVKSLEGDRDKLLLAVAELAQRDGELEKDDEVLGPSLASVKDAVRRNAQSLRDEPDDEGDGR